MEKYIYASLRFFCNFPIFYNAYIFKIPKVTQIKKNTLNIS